MMNTLKSILIVAALIAGVGATWHNSGEDIAPQPSSFYEVINSSEWLLLRSIRQEGLNLIKSALARGYSKEELIEAFKAELESTANIDAGAVPSEAVKMIYGDQASADEFMLRLNDATAALLNKFPDIAELSTDSACSPTEQKIEGFFANFERIHAQGTSSEVNAVDCEWIAYTACLLVCTSSGPVLYWVCAYLCLSSFCEFQ